MPKLVFRRATQLDVPSIVQLLADDELGSQREARSEAELAPYHAAFQELDADPNQLLAVVEDREEVVGTLQLSFIPGLAHRGAKRGQIEAVRVATHRRGEKIGESLFEWALEQCAIHHCAIVQLTTDKRRIGAHRFYERLGFEPTHVGYKLTL